MKCDECNKINGHEEYCCLSAAVASKPSAKQTWICKTASGMIRRFTFPANTAAEFVMEYANREARRDFVAQVVSASMEVA